MKLSFIQRLIYRILATARITSALFGNSFLSRDQTETFNIIGPIMLYINSAINPTLYALGSRFYRKAFVQAMRIDKCCATKAKDNSRNFTGVSTVSSKEEKAVVRKTAM